MPNKSVPSRNKNFLLLFIFVMVLNTLLIGVLIQSSFSQSKQIDFSHQLPVKVEVAKQKNCPVQITVINIDNSQAFFQTINYSLQNISGKSIRAYSLLEDGKSDGKTITSFFTTELFYPNKYKLNNVPLERTVVIDNETVSLSIDYIQFTDGTSWGNDTQGKSKEISGQIDGVKAAVKQLNKLIKNQNINNFKNLLEKNAQEIHIEEPITIQSDDWKKGFYAGYKSVFSVLRDESDQTIQNLIQKLGEVEKNIS